MPSSPSPSLLLEEQFTGEGINIWGILLDQVIAMIDAGIAGMATLVITGDTAPTRTNYVPDESRNAILKLTGTPAANFALTIASVTKIYFIWNATTKVATITTGSGSTVLIDGGDVIVVFCDGTNVKTLSYGGLSLKDYITAQTASAGAVPGTTGALGKFLKVTVDGGASTWQQILAADIGDIESYVRQRTLVYSLVFGGA